MNSRSSETPCLVVVPRLSTSVLAEPVSAHQGTTHTHKTTPDEGSNLSLFALWGYLETSMGYLILLSVLSFYGALCVVFIALLRK